MLFGDTFSEYFFCFLNIFKLSPAVYYQLLINIWSWERISRHFSIFFLIFLLILGIFIPFFILKFGVPSISSLSSAASTQTIEPDINGQLPPPLEFSFLEKLFGQFSSGSPFSYNLFNLYFFLAICICGFIIYLKKSITILILSILWIIIPSIFDFLGINNSLHC